MIDASSSGSSLGLFLAPQIQVLAVSVLFIGVAEIAVRLSPGDRARDKHFVYVASLGAAFLAMVLSWVIRGLFGELPPIFERYVSPLYGQIWLGIFALGAVAFVVRLYLGTSAVAKIIIASRPLGEDQQDAVRRAADVVRPGRKFTVRTSPLAEAPFTTGIIRPQIVLPPSFVEEAIETQFSVLVHELSHVKRRDCLVELFVQFVGVWLWWNPLYWVAARRIALLREIACDEFVLTRGTSRVPYMRLLLRLARITPGLSRISFSTIYMARRSNLGLRLHAIDGPAPRERGEWLVLSLMPATLSRRAVLATLLVMVCLVLAAEHAVVAATDLRDKGTRVLEPDLRGERWDSGTKEREWYRY